LPRSDVSITVYPAAEWKFTFTTRFKELFRTVKNPKELGDAIAQELPAYASDVRALAFNVHKNQRLLPTVDRTADEEINVLRAAAETIARTLAVRVSIGKTTDDHPRANAGMPGRPAIVVQ
jgi:hypothetical protein